MGLGNVDQGDDGFGVRLAETLRRTGLPDSVEVVLAGTDPEYFVGRYSAAGFDHLIFLDAVAFGAAPGSVVLLNSREMTVRFPQVSTHKLSLGMLAGFVEAGGKTRAWLLGAQPQSLKPSHRLSPALQTTVALLAELIATHFPAEAHAC
jgi:hydrogenase maturation protease